MNSYVLQHQEYIKASIKGYDKSLSCPKGKLYSVIESIDEYPDIANSTIHNQFNLLLRAIGFFLLRKNQKQKAQWLQDSAREILYMLYVYKCLKQSVFKVDDTLLLWYSKVNYAEDILNEDFQSFVFLHNDQLYYVDKSDDAVEISLLSSSPKPGRPGYNLLHTINADTLRMLCNNKECPRWKNSMNKAFIDESKFCSCTVADTQKCGHIRKCGILEPLESLDMSSAIVCCMNHRAYSDSMNKRDPDEYEHIPKPQREDDVVVYFGFNNIIKESSNNELYPIPSSHASPREHHRRGGTRRGYYRKDGTWVRPTTFKETTVNKGYTKTNYVLKEKKGE